ncbi:hypothetical protein BD779DRAFT_1468587 [Infundibulicybe gibba]|nr:hypothetical protein BD779DRAFT_1468587 [Infundibulicybe gibba]
MKVGMLSELFVVWDDAVLMAGDSRTSKLEREEHVTSCKPQLLDGYRVSVLTTTKKPVVAHPNPNKGDNTDVMPHVLAYLLHQISTTRTLFETTRIMDILPPSPALLAMELDPSRNIISPPVEVTVLVAFSAPCLMRRPSQMQQRSRGQDHMECALVTGAIQDC